MPFSIAHFCPFSRSLPSLLSIYPDSHARRGYAADTPVCRCHPRGSYLECSLLLARSWSTPLAADWAIEPLLIRLPPSLFPPAVPSLPRLCRCLSPPPHPPFRLVLRHRLPPHFPYTPQQWQLLRKWSIVQINHKKRIAPPPEDASLAGESLLCEGGESARSCGKVSVFHVWKHVFSIFV